MNPVSRILFSDSAVNSNAAVLAGKIADGSAIGLQRAIHILRAPDHKNNSANIIRFHHAMMHGFVK